jgi:hypothetical protein
MSSSRGGGRPQGEGGSVLEGSWLWVALPVGVLGLIAALWFLVIAPAGGPPPRATVTPQVTVTPIWPTVTPMGALATDVPEPTPEPTAGPTAEPTQPTAVGVGARVEVAGTAGQQLRVRQEPGLNTVTLKFVPDGTKFVVVGGPEQASGLTWWKVDDQAGTVGWVAADYIRLAP